MYFKIISIKIECTRGSIFIPFSDDISFFCGNTGVGKTTLLNLINYALGQNLIYTHVVEKSVENICVEIICCEKRLLIYRRISSNLITVNDTNKTYSFLAKNDNSEKNTFSDFLYHISNLEPVEMLRGRSSKTVKISFSNYMWYSYLKQHEMENSLFYLDEKNNNFKCSASNYVLRTVLNYKNNLKKDITQEINKIKENQNAIKLKLSVLKEINSTSRLFQINIGEEIARKYQLIGKLNNDIEFIKENSCNISKNTIIELIDVSKATGKYEGEIRYLQEFNKILCLYKKYASMYEDYDEQRAIYEQKLSSIRDDLFLDNLSILQSLFKESLLDINFPGFSQDDNIVIDQQSFIPSVYSETNEFLFDYQSLSSSGIRTIYKICFIISLHRLIKKRRINCLIPSLIMIDTPMKNISERIDKKIFTDLYKYLFNLFSVGGELYGTQLIVIDKEIPSIFEKNNTYCKMFTKDNPLISLFLVEQ